MNSEQKLIIVGAGLCGSLLAIKMAQRGFLVTVYEKRPDLRKRRGDAGRSINLALSDRGLMALESAGLKDTILKQCIPMRGRLIHPIAEEPFLSPYSGKASSYINSVSRPGLNTMLLEEASKYPNISMHFETSVEKVNLQEASVEFVNTEGLVGTDKGTVVIGTDGTGSAVRKSFLDNTPQLRFDCSQEFMGHGYKELSIHPTAAGEWKLEKEALHIWPRGDFMIIALPNLDGSFTLTMFHPFGGEYGFDVLQTWPKVLDFFQQFYPTLLPYVPHLEEEFFANPVGNLGTVKGYPWQAFGKALLMGDAAHAIVPFYGQGMNASLEDVRVFDDLIQKHGTSWEVVFDEFQQLRKPNADAIADLAIENYFEMRDKVKELPFMRKRQIEMQLEQHYPDYSSKYSMVTFQPEMPYKNAMDLGRAQDDLLLGLCEKDDFEDIPLKTYHERLSALKESEFSKNG